MTIQSYISLVLYRSGQCAKAEDGVTFDNIYGKHRCLCNN